MLVAIMMVMRRTCKVIVCNGGLIASSATAPMIVSVDHEWDPDRDLRLVTSHSQVPTAGEEFHCCEETGENSCNALKQLLILGFEVLRLVPITSDLRPEDFPGGCVSRTCLRLEVIKCPIP